MESKDIKIDHANFYEQLKKCIKFLSMMDLNIMKFCNEKLKKLQELIKIKNIDAIELLENHVECGGNCEELRKLGLELGQPKKIKRSVLMNENKKKNWQKTRFYEKL